MRAVKSQLNTGCLYSSLRGIFCRRHPQHAGFCTAMSNKGIFPHTLHQPHDCPYRAIIMPTLHTFQSLTIYAHGVFLSLVTTALQVCQRPLASCPAVHTRGIMTVPWNLPTTRAFDRLPISSIVARFGSRRLRKHSNRASRRLHCCRASLYCPTNHQAPLPSQAPTQARAHPLSSPRGCAQGRGRRCRLGEGTPHSRCRTRIPRAERGRIQTSWKLRCLTDTLL